MATALIAVEGPSRAIPGVVHFDVARRLTDPNRFVVTEVFEHRDAFDRQNVQSEVADGLRLADDGALVGDYEFAVWEAPARA